MFTENLSAVTLAQAGLNPAPAGIREFCLPVRVRTQTGMKKAQESNDLKILVHSS